MDKPTPGPWELTDENRARRVIRSVGPKPRTVCIIESWTTEPDAHLLAAAPALADALEAYRLAHTKDGCRMTITYGDTSCRLCVAADLVLRAAGRLP